MKLEKYNQRLLAIIGTLVLVSLVIIILTSGTFFIIEIVNDYRRDQRDNTLVAKPTYDSISGTLIRTQQITFEQPLLIDSASRLYVVPVSQVSLEEHENINEILDFDRRSKLKIGKNYQNTNQYGRYNNLIVYNQNQNNKNFLFNDKVSVNHFSYHELKGKFYIFLEGTKVDSNKDGYLNDNDLASFFVYDVDKKELLEFTYPSMGLMDYYLTKDESEVILSFAIDKDKNGSIDEYQEPVILKKLSIENKEVFDFIEGSQIEMIQKMVDH